MSSRFFQPFIASLLAGVLLTQVTFFTLPQTTYANALDTTTGSFVPTSDFITELKTTITSVATVATQINSYVLQPLAFVMSVGLIKSLTAGVIAFVIGQSNGTGQPQFVQNIEGSLQKVGDIKAQAFFLQFGKNSNSPFAASITSSLRTTYLQQTSLAGFWAANRCTLFAASPNINSFLAGNWSQGGAKAWFALTTQPQNNPYTLYQTSQNQLASVVASAQETRDKVLSWGQGFMSWCGEADAGVSTGGNNPSAMGVNPGDPCQKADGTPGVMKTPGATIKATLDKVTGSVQDKLIQMGSVAKEVNGIMQNVATIFQTINLAQSLLGGSGGLAGFGATSAGNATSPLSQYDRSAFLGVTTDTVYQNAATIQATAAEAAATRVDKFEAAWNTIKGSAQAASAALTDLAAVCTAEAAQAASAALTDRAAACTKEATDAQKAIVDEINPILTSASDAATTVATARTFIAKVISEENLTTDAGKAAYFDDLEKLENLSPTDAEVMAIESQTVAHGYGVLAVPDGSFAVSGGSLVGQMNLIIANAATHKLVCTAPASDGGGGGA